MRGRESYWLFIGDGVILAVIPPVGSDLRSHDPRGNEMHTLLMCLHRLVQCSYFFLATSQKYHCLREIGEQSKILSSQLTAELYLVAQPVGRWSLGKALEIAEARAIIVFDRSMASATGPSLTLPSCYSPAASRSALLQGSQRSSGPRV
jgi:hypothetical protein